MELQDLKRNLRTEGSFLKTKAGSNGNGTKRVPYEVMYLGNKKFQISTKTAEQYQICGNAEIKIDGKVSLEKHDYANGLTIKGTVDEQGLPTYVCFAPVTKSTTRGSTTINNNKFTCGALEIYLSNKGDITIGTKTPLSIHQNGDGTLVIQAESTSATASENNTSEN